MESANGFVRPYPVLGGGYLLAGRAAADIKRRLTEKGMPAALVRRVIVATYEAEMNICIHAVSGEVQVNVEGDRVSVVVSDRGPGIADLKAALKPGFSTAPAKARQRGFGAGMGFSNMQRCADEFRISSEVGAGTKVEMAFSPRVSELEEGAAL